MGRVTRSTHVEIAGEARPVVADTECSFPMVRFDCSDARYQQHASVLSLRGDVVHLHAVTFAPGGPPCRDSCFFHSCQSVSRCHFCTAEVRADGRSIVWLTPMQCKAARQPWV